MPTTSPVFPGSAFDVDDALISTARSGMWKDFVALMRSAGFVCTVNVGRISEYVSVYHREVTPIIESVLGHLESHPYTNDLLCEESIRLCYFLDGYCKMADVPVRYDLALLGAAVARVYDDLVDDHGDDALLARLSVLFASGTFEPVSDAEQLFHLLYSELERRLGSHRDHPIYDAMIALHKAQTNSRKQRDPLIPTSCLADIAWEKGGNALIVLLYLMKPNMSDEERGVMLRLGGLLQLVDDHQDVDLDRQAGVATAATRGQLSLAVICRRLREIRPAVRSLYGDDQPLFGLIYMSLCVTFLYRYLPRRLTEGPVKRGLVRCVRLSERLKPRS